MTLLIIRINAFLCLSGMMILTSVYVDVGHSHPNPERDFWGYEAQHTCAKPQHRWDTQ